MIKNIDDELIKILLSLTNKDQIRYLYNADVLNNEEKKLCDAIIDNYAILGKHNISSVLKQNGMNIEEINSIVPYEESKILIMIDEWTIKRRKQYNQKICNDVLDITNYDVFSKEAIDIINKRYKANIEIKERKILDELECFVDLDEEKLSDGIPTGIKNIDEMTHGLPIGKVTSIVGMDKIYRHMIVINMVYKLIMQGKNILFLSFDYNQKNIYLDLISRHSCDLKFGKSLSKLELINKKNRDTYSCLYRDIKNYFDTHLVLFDEEDLNMQNIFVFQRLFTIANDKFVKSTNNPIDLIVIDGLSNLHIETSRRIITNRNLVEKEYYSFFKDMASNFLGTGDQIPIIVTNESLSTYNELLEQGVYYNLSYISDIVKTYSSVILAVKGDNSSNRSKVIEVSLLKSLDGNLINQILVKADKEYNLIYYTQESLDEKVDNEVMLQYLKNKVEELKEDNERYESAAKFTNNLLENCLNDNRHYKEQLEIERANNKNDTDTNSNIDSSLLDLFNSEGQSKEKACN